MTEIIIIRHGETEWNQTGRFQGHSDVPLSETGRAQAEALGRNLAIDHVDAIYASDLTRAIETAAPLAARFSLTVTPDPLLRELNFGAWEGRSFSDVNVENPNAMKQFYNDPECADIPDSEPFPDFQSAWRAAFVRLQNCIAANALSLSHMEHPSESCLPISSPCRFVRYGIYPSSTQQSTRFVSKTMALPL